MRPSIRRSRVGEILGVLFSGKYQQYLVGSVLQASHNWHFLSVRVMPLDTEA